jgi:hypothetical protein
LGARVLGLLTVCWVIRYGPRFLSQSAVRSKSINLEFTTMKHDTVRTTAFAMPLTSPAFPPGPYRFVNREYFIIQYRTDPDALRAGCDA